jgi:hypothetical protein
MGVPNCDRIQELFDEALGLDGPARDAFLAAACKGDEALLEEVRSLLAAHDQAGSFIQPLAATVVEGSPSRKGGGERDAPAAVTAIQAGKIRWSS